jgi:LysR family transcriptional regulator for metE and metH
VDNAAFGPHPFVIIGPPDHRLAGRPVLSLKDFSEEPFVLREQGSGTRALMEELFLGADIVPRIGMQIGSNETIKQAVIAGLGVAVISAHTVAAEINDRRLVAFDVAELPVMRTWFVVKRGDKRLLPAPQALWEFIKTSGSHFLPDTSRFVAPG